MHKGSRFVELIVLQAGKVQALPKEMFRLAEVPAIEFHDAPGPRQLTTYSARKEGTFPSRLGQLLVSLAWMTQAMVRNPQSHMPFNAQVTRRQLAGHVSV